LHFVRKNLVSQGVTAKEFVLFLKKVPGYDDKSLFGTEVSKLNEASDLVDVFEIVGDRCSWFNHLFIEQIIKMYCKGNKKIEKAHKEYCTHLQTTVSIMSESVLSRMGLDQEERKT